VSLPVTTTPEAESHIRTIDVWWRDNRRAAPDLFLDELSEAFGILARAPHIGRPYRRSPVGTRFINELLALVDKGDVDNTVHLEAERERLRKEVSNLLDLAASGVSADTLAPKIREREADIARLDATLRTPRQAPNIEKLRAALQQRAAQWRADLRAEPKLARLLLRRLVGPLTLWNDAVASAEWVDWEASLTPALLDGLAPISETWRVLQDVASREGAAPFHGGADVERLASLNPFLLVGRVGSRRAA
jgi:plasmid stabilization system protein ParE